MRDLGWLGRTLVMIVGTTLVLTACGDGGDALEPGEVQQVSGVATPVATAGPEYCQIIEELDGLRRGSANNQELLDVVTRLVVAVAEEGPPSVAERFAGMGEALDGLDEVLRRHGYDTDLDAVALTPDEQSALLTAGIALAAVQSTPREDVLALMAECASADLDRDELAEAFAGIAPSPVPAESGEAGDDDPLSSVAPGVVRTALEGPFGSGSHGHVVFTIESATVSNLAPLEWTADGDVTPNDPDARYLYVGVVLENTDPNDDVAVQAGDLVLLVDGVPVGSAEEVNVRDFGGVIATQAAVEREYVWSVEGTVSPASLTIRYADGTVPMDVPFDTAVTVEVGYPIEAAPPGSGTYVNGIGCDIRYTVDLERAAYELDIPADFDFGVAFMQNRAPAGSRWLVLEGFVTSGPADCTSTQGTVTRENLRLVVDGRPIEPIVAPLATLFANESLPLQLVWEVPVDVEDLVFRAIGAREDTVDIPVEVPELPLVHGS